MGGIGSHNFDAQSHEQLYDKIHSGPGHSAVQAVDDAWNSFRAVMGNAKSELESAIRDAGVVWVGAAGERFTGSAAPLVQWAEDARVAGVETHNAFSAQASHYSGAKTRMPEPVEVTSTANDDFLGIPAGFTHLVGGQTDQDVQEQQANEAKREAVRVMNGYRDGASSAVSLLGTFTPPPQVTTQVTEPTFEQSEAQSRYSQQFSDGRWSTPATTDTSRTTTAQPQQPVGPPPAVAPIGGDTNTSAVGTTPEVAPRPGTTPITPPPYAPGPPQPPVAVPPPRMIRPKSVPDFHDRRTSFGGNPPGKGTGSGIPKGIGGNPPGGASRFGGGLPGVPGHPGHGGQPFGHGSSSGMAGEQHANRAGAGGAAGARAAAGAPVVGGMAGAPQGGRGEEDIEHKAAPYLEELDDVWGEDSMPRVAPPVIGDDGL
ncbi:PPE family protein [Actinosynnema sp. NPDC091369]